jgi:hypothetical protein
MGTSEEQMVPFDTVIHTCGEQALPILMGCLAVPAKRHVFVCSKKTEPLIARICREAGVDDADALAVEVNPFDIAQISSRLAEAVDSGTGNVSVNITGGTKPMSIACLTTALRKNWQAFYIDTTDRMIIWLSGDRGREQLRPLFTSVEPFIRLSGESIAFPGLTQPTETITARKKLTRLIADRMASLMNKMAQPIIRERLNEKPGVPFDITAGKVRACLRNDRSATFDSPAGNFIFSEMPDFAAYLAGGWFEEYGYWSLLPLHCEEKVFDLRMNVSTTYSETVGGKKKNEHQEIDLLFTNGYNLFLIESKSGSVKQEHIQKLENLAARYGGAFGKGVLVSLFPPSYGSFPDRVRQSRNIACISGSAVVKLAERILTINPGTFHGSPPKQQPTKR